MLDPFWLDLLIALLAAPAATVQGLEALRIQPKARYWIAALAMLPVISIVWFSGARLLPLSAAAAASWAVLLFACLTRRRRLAIACVLLCGLFAASSKLAALAAQRAVGAASSPTLSDR